MRAVGVFETLRVVHQATLFNISEDSNLQQHRCEHHKCGFVFLYIALPINVCTAAMGTTRPLYFCDATRDLLLETQNTNICNSANCCFHPNLYKSTGLFKMTVGILTTCHTQYTSDSSICIFLFNRTTLQVFVTYLTGALYVHPL